MFFRSIVPILAIIILAAASVVSTTFLLHFVKTFSSTQRYSQNVMEEIATFSSLRIVRSYIYDIRDGLILYLTFDENSGNITYDYSGNGHFGIIYHFNRVNITYCDSLDYWYTNEGNISLSSDRREEKYAILYNITNVVANKEYKLIYDPPGTWDFSKAEYIAFWRKGDLSDWNEVFNSRKFCIYDINGNYACYGLWFDGGWRYSRWDLSKPYEASANPVDWSHIDKIVFIFNFSKSISYFYFYVDEIGILEPTKSKFCKGKFQNAVYHEYDDYIVLSDDIPIFGYHDFTIVFWYKPYAWRDYWQQVFQDDWTREVKNGYFTLEYRGVLQIVTRSSDTAELFGVATKTYCNVNNWCFVAFVRKGRLWYAYLNDTFNSGKDTRNGTEESFHWLIGRERGWGGRGFYGVLDEFRIYIRALSEEEIKKLYYHYLDCKFGLHLVLVNEGGGIIDLNNTIAIINGCSEKLVYNVTFITDNGSNYIKPKEVVTLKIFPGKCKIYTDKENYVCLIKGLYKICTKVSYY